jgi:hypothetical protein
VLGRSNISGIHPEILLLPIITLKKEMHERCTINVKK